MIMLLQSSASGCGYSPIFAIGSWLLLSQFYRPFASILSG